MNNHLAPTYKKPFGDYWVLWYATSNSYSVVESKFKLLIDLYLESDTVSEFENKISSYSVASDFSVVIETIESYLISCNKDIFPTLNKATELNKSYRNISKCYDLNGNVIQVYYNTESVLKTIHPSIAHCEVENIVSTNTTFDIYFDKSELFLFKNEQLITRAPKRDYHLIQGKFIMHMLCTLHNNTEQDWISTFHGSTITDNISSLLFIGASGKGKSTLCAILASNGFQLVADDVSPMLSKDNHIYFNPSAISIKEGAFKILEPMVKGFKDLPIVNFNNVKGDLKYVPCPIPKSKHYPCKAIILVNYKNKSETKLEPVSVKTLLETLIPESWLSPNPLHAKQFLDWLEEQKIYELTYSDNKEVIEEISNLFNVIKN